MTAAERQQKRRKRLRKEQGAELSRKMRLKARQKAAEHYIPTPPGITYWRKVPIITADGQREPGVPPTGPVIMWQPKTRPLASCETDLEDDDIRALLRRLHEVARKRGIEIDAE